MAAWTLGMAPAAFANPVLDAKDAAVSISGTADMSITSAAANNLIKWVDFSIKSGEKVTFDAKNYLNYVTGSAVSDIQGTLKGTGNIYLVNPNGILIGDNATVNVGSLYLSTKNLTADQLANYSTATGALFKNDNAAVGDVINLGNLNATAISVEGNNITFKNTADVTGTVSLTANSGGEIHIGSIGGTVSGYAVSGAAEIDYKLIGDASGLQNMTANGNYMLANDISNVTIEPDKVINNHTGRFDGLNHRLSNLTIKLGGYGYGGLFRMNNGTIENLEISGITFTDATGEWDPNAIGAVAGYNENGTIKNVRNTGSMTIAIDRTVNNIGGIAGINKGTIENASNAANISYDKIINNLGGISGYNEGKIVNAFNSGAMEGTDSRQVGGIVGSNDSGGTIENASNTGAIQNETSDAVGGITGSNDGTLQNVSNTGTVNGVVPEESTPEPTPEPVTPTNPTNPVNPNPTTPIAPTNPITPNPETSTNPTNPAMPTDPTNPVNPEPATPTNPTNPVSPTPATPASEPAAELPAALEAIAGNGEAAKEYTDAIVSLQSDSKAGATSAAAAAAASGAATTTTSQPLFAMEATAAQLPDNFDPLASALREEAIAERTTSNMEDEEEEE